MSTGKSAIMPPPPTLASPPMQRPGVREIHESGQRPTAPGLVQRSGTPAQLEAMRHPDDPPAVEAEPDSKLPKPQQSRIVERAATHEIPPHGGRIPKVGDIVSYWMRDLTQKIVEYPAQLIWWNNTSLKWALNLHQVGRVQGRHDITFSESPADCCWTWPTAISSAGGDALATAESAFEMCATLAKEMAVLRNELAEARKEIEASGNRTQPVAPRADTRKPKAKEATEAPVVDSQKEQPQTASSESVP